MMQDKEVVNIVFSYMESSAWWAAPEMLLQTLLCSSEKEERQFAVNMIKKIRDDVDENGNNVIRTHHKIHFNRDAKSLKDLIQWENEILKKVQH